jgi:tetratricopeptide (TPR) repeat protein
MAEGIGEDEATGAADAAPETLRASSATPVVFISYASPCTPMRSFGRSALPKPLSWCSRKVPSRPHTSAKRSSAPPRSSARLSHCASMLRRSPLRSSTSSVNHSQIAPAIAEFESEKSAWRAFGLPMSYYAQGRTDVANAALAALAALVQKSAGSEFQVAETYAYFGNPDHAFAWLDQAVDHDPGIQWLRGDPLFKGITADSRYADLLRRLKLPM